MKSAIAADSVSLDEARVAPPDMERGRSGRQPQGLAVVVDRAGGVAQRQTRPRPAGIARGIVGAKPDGLIEVGHGLRIGAGVGPRIAAVAIGERLVGGAVGGACNDLRAGAQSGSASCGSGCNRQAYRRRPPFAVAATTRHASPIRLIFLPSLGCRRPARRVVVEPKSCGGVLGAVVARGRATALDAGQRAIARDSGSFAPAASGHAPGIKLWSAEANRCLCCARLA